MHIKALLIVLLALIFLAGCGYNKNTFVRVSGEDLSIPLKGIGTIRGKKVEATISRQVNYTAEKGRKLDVSHEQGDHKASVKVK